MKKLLLAAAALVAMSLPSFAADMPLKAPVAPVFVPSWNGFYIGFNGGYGWAGDSTVTISDPFTATGVGFGVAGPRAFALGNDSAGALAGAHIGYNFQLATSWLIGVEADWDWSGINGRAMVTPIPNPFDIRPGDFLTTAFEANQLATIRGRLGWTSPTWMAYLTGGAAWGSFTAAGDIVCPTGPCGTPIHAAGRFDFDRWGWVVGGGAEFRVGTTGFILGAEYLYYRFEGTDGVSVPTTNLTTGALVTFGTCPAPGTPCVTHSAGDFDIHTLRARLSYKF